MTATLIWTLVVLVAVGLYLSWTAGRLDRLHARIDAARAALDAQLLRRASVAQELATSKVLDPAASIVLYEAAHAARQAEEEQREVAESELSQALRAVFADARQLDVVREAPGGDAAARELAEAVRRVPWPAASTTTRWARSAASANTARSAGSAWPATPRSRWPSKWTTNPRRPCPTARADPDRENTGQVSAGFGESSEKDPPAVHWPLLWTGPFAFPRWCRNPLFNE